MASIIKHRDKWRATVSVGKSRASRSFSTKREAQAWASEEETVLRREQGGEIPDKPFGDLLNRYAEEVSVTKRGVRRERVMIGALMRDALAAVPLKDLAPRHVSAWKERRLKAVSGATVDREMTILTHACKIGWKEWGWLRSNPVSDVSRPPPTAARTRRPTQKEIDDVLYALGYLSDQPPETAMARVGAAFLFAIETAMRAGEICALTWDHIHDRHVHLPKTKNGYIRDVPLTAEARRILAQLKPLGHDPVFGLGTASLDALFRKAKARVMIEDLHFHDSRREALTRLAKTFGVMELARISGHRDLRVLQGVYYAPDVADLADKLG